MNPNLTPFEWLLFVISIIVAIIGFIQFIELYINDNDEE